MERSKKFPEMFALLGSHWRIDSGLQALREEYVCSFFMSGKFDISEVRYELCRCRTIYEEKDGIHGLSLPPPCCETLNVGSQRCNYITRV